MIPQQSPSSRPRLWRRQYAGPTCPLPPLFFAVLVAFVVTYLALVQLFKQRFYAAGGWRGH